MAFATRVFCRDLSPPGIAELLLWLQQHEVPATVSGAESRDDLLSTFWSELELAYDPAEEPFRISLCRIDGPGASRLQEEVADFLEDLLEVPAGPARELVEAQIRATRMLLVVEFPAASVTPRGFEMNGWLMELFVERAAGMVQADGIGFYDENDEIILRMS